MAAPIGAIRSAASPPTQALHSRPARLSGFAPIAALASVLPVAPTSAIISAVVLSVDPALACSRAVTDVVYGVSLFAVLAAVLAWPSADERRAAMPIERPSAAELWWTAISVSLAVAAFLAGAAAGEALGFELGGSASDLGDPVSLGLAGVLAIAAWAVFPTLLRLKFDNLVGAWLLHAVDKL